MFISEFGACLTEAACTQEISQVANVSDDALVGWAYWEFKTYKDLTTSAGTGEEGFYNADGSLQDWKVKALARSYLMAAQGVPTLFNFDMESSAFEAEFTVDTSIQAPTILFASKEYYYPNGTQVTITVDGVELTTSQVEYFETDDNHMKITVTDSTLSGKTVRIVCVAL